VRFVGVFLGIIILMSIGGAMGYVMARTDAKRQVRREMERDGWTARHHSVYLSAIRVLNKIVRAYELDAPMEFRVVQLPDNLRDEAQKVIERYRKENGA